MRARQSLLWRVGGWTTRMQPLNSKPISSLASLVARCGSGKSPLPNLNRTLPRLWPQTGCPRPYAFLSSICALSCFNGTGRRIGVKSGLLLLGVGGRCPTVGTGWAVDASFGEGCPPMAFHPAHGTVRSAGRGRNSTAALWCCARRIGSVFRCGQYR